MFRKLAIFLVMLTAFATAQAQQKKRVAVMNFDYATVRSTVASATRPCTLTLTVGRRAAF